MQWRAARAGLAPAGRPDCDGHSSCRASCPSAEAPASSTPTPADPPPYPEAWIREAETTNESLSCREVIYKQGCSNTRVGSVTVAITLAPDGKVLRLDQIDNTVENEPEFVWRCLVRKLPMCVRRAEVKPGTRLWTLSFDATMGTPSHAATDADGNVLWTYPLSGSVNLPTGVISTDVFDVLVGKVSRQGTLLWARPLDLPSHEVRALAVDAGGGLVLAGMFTERRAQGQTDQGGFILRLSPDGGMDWKIAFDGNVVPDNVGVDARGEVTLTGGMQETVDFGGGPLTSPFSRNSTSYTWFLARFGRDGRHVWSTKTDFHRFPPHAFTSDGSIVLAPDAAAPMTLFGATLDAGPHLVRIDAAGKVVSSRPLSVSATKLAASDNRVCALAWDPPLTGLGYAGKPSSRLALQCFDARGALVFDRTLSDPKNPQTRDKHISVHDMVLDPSGFVAITGSTVGDAPLDAFTLTGGQFIAGLRRRWENTLRHTGPLPRELRAGP
ncbi:hypothetical protein [Polyangium sp. 15x6]|uniref:hypothetical protein n=1 Tax=Polyangium sp. 15x6 TaxID=3042687 RepID=UPI00249C95A1|nr:hypothetical protein [Polyangium sp. 15x6]MDI3285779.1 hypothetical protein [Polyangium sp. 15x6]